mmetsp:Transcript_17465/g.38261  ORF Transcript_17465/g.38261 Transcript_17465/m.38261 type:complete len:82 (-) Transcript_17465:165-410(-)
MEWPGSTLFQCESQRRLARMVLGMTISMLIFLSVPSELLAIIAVVMFYLEVQTRRLSSRGEPYGLARAMTLDWHIWREGEA